MITSGQAKLDERCRSLSDHGASRSDHQRRPESSGFLLSEYDVLGYNYRMTDMQGALGCAQIDRVVWILERRRLIAERYDEMLADLDWLQTPQVPHGSVHGYQSYVCLLRPEQPTPENVNPLHEQRTQLMARMEPDGVATRQATHAPPLQGHYHQKNPLPPPHSPT